MAEQFKNTYISAKEFVSSWEKEIYELTNLDYFIYLLINDLALTIDADFFSNIDQSDFFYLNQEEIGNLAFNVGDTLQSFLEKNCFGSCALRCPCKLDEEIDSRENAFRQGLLAELDMDSKVCQTKEYCLQSDLTDYVILDSLLDFFNYEMGVILEENDARLKKLAALIMDLILSFVRLKGQRLLRYAEENAGNRFDEMINSEESSWEDTIGGKDEEFDDEEGEEWKLTSSSIEHVIENYKTSFEDHSAAFIETKILDKLKNFLIEFLEVDKIEDLTIEDLEEFIAIVTVNELILDNYFELEDISPLFEKFLEHVAFNYEVFLQESFGEFKENSFNEIVRTFKIARRYQEQNSLLDHLMCSKKDDPTLVEGFFEVTDKKGYDFYLEDIHLKTKFEPVDFSSIGANDLKTGDILHLQIVTKGVGWELLFLEMVYPLQAKFYLY